MLAERFHTDFFDRIEAEAAVSGSSRTVERIETALQTDASTTSSGRPKKSAKKEPQPDGEIPASDWVNRWAAMPPAFTGLDLRPYLFVSRDRKALFTSGSALALKEDWIEKLCGSKLGARAAAVEVAKLTSGEIEQIFDMVSSRVRAATSLAKKPAGVDGIIELCRISKALQTPTIRLLADLPTGKLGPWAAAGWEALLTDDVAKAEFKKLKQVWAKQDENKPLSLAAAPAPNRKSNEAT